MTNYDNLHITSVGTQEEADTLMVLHATYNPVWTI